MRKGQSGSILTMVFALPVIVISILIGFWVYGSVSGILPHDETINNETMCTTCVNSTNYEFANYPINNDTSLVCFNDSNQLMTNGIVADTCLGFNINNNRYINLTNTSGTMNCYTSNVVCTYRVDDATEHAEGFWTTATTNINASYTLGSVAMIVLAAVIIIMVVVLVGKQG